MGRPYNPANNSVGAGACIGQCITFRPAVGTRDARLRQHTSAQELMALREARRAAEPCSSPPAAQFKVHGEAGRRHGYEPFRSSLSPQVQGYGYEEAVRRWTAAAGASRSKAATPSRPSTAAADSDPPGPSGAAASALAAAGTPPPPATPGQRSRPATAASSIPRGAIPRPATAASLQRLHTPTPTSRPPTSSSSQLLTLGPRPGTAASITSLHSTSAPLPPSAAPLPPSAAALLPGSRPMTSAQLAAAQVAPAPRTRPLGGRTSRRNKTSLSNLLDDGSCSVGMVLLPPAALLGAHSMDTRYWKNTWQPRLDLDVELGRNLVPGLSPGTQLVGGEWRCMQPKC